MTTMMAATSTTSSETWRDVPGYEGLYKVSDRGRLRNARGELKKPTKNYNGYLRVNLYKGGVGRQFSLHILIAQAFIPNPENKPEVNHKNGKRDDCWAENLEWTTHSENQLHRRRVLNSGGGGKKRSVLCLTTGVTYESISAAARGTDSRLTGVLACLRGYQTQTNGLRFCYKE